MEIEWTRVVGLVVALLVVVAFSRLVTRYEFPAFEHADPSSELVEVGTAIGPKVSGFLWTYRLVDLIAQAFVLFVAATCCVALLRSEDERK